MAGNISERVVDAAQAAHLSAACILSLHWLQTGREIVNDFVIGISYQGSVGKVWAPEDFGSA
jgi:hypothetical protein